jgi:hypothetical protein
VPELFVRKELFKPAWVVIQKIASDRVMLRVLEGDWRDSGTAELEDTSTGIGKENG